VCHVPHDHNKAVQDYTNGLLWNHQVSTQNYQMYDSTFSPTLTGVQESQPVGNSKLCLACHDGTVGIDSFDGSHAGTEFIGAGSLRVPNFSTSAGDKDLRGTHPLSIRFPSDYLTSGAFNNPAETAWASGDKVASTLQDGMVQCSTCHDVHDKDAVASTHLLRTANSSNANAGSGLASGLCLTCHKK